MTDPTNKKFRLAPDEFKSLAPGLGGCYATDKIPVDGRKVGFMYRESPDFGGDSGWRFFSGTESTEYVDNPDHIAIYDVNTIANYDPEIIPFLNSPIGSAFERDNGEGAFREVFDFEAPTE